MTEPWCLTTDDVARILGTNRRHVRYLCHRRKDRLVAWKLLRDLRIQRDDLDDWMARQ